MDVKCSFSVSVEMEDLGSLRMERDHIVHVWKAPQTHVVSISKGLTCQLNVHSLASNGLYFRSFYAMESPRSLSLQKVNLIS